MDAVHLFHTSREANVQPGTVKTAVILIGFSAVTGQAILMRELISVFNGNEISLGIMLAIWLLWTAAGGFLGGRFAASEINTRRAVAMLECLLGSSLPPTIWALRASKSLVQTVPGELVGPVPVLLASLACLGVFCVISGALFAVAARMYVDEYAVHAQIATNSAYLLEAAGSAIGGVGTSLVFVRYLEPFQIAAVVLVLNLFMAATLLFGISGKRLWALAAAGALLASSLVVEVAPSIDASARERQWRGFHLVASRDSIYGNLAVIETGNTRSLYENGVILASTADESAAEEAVHYALLEHPAPRNVLLIGGGVTGSIAQALKHPTVESVDYIELDPALIGMAQQFIPAQNAASFSDPRVHIHFADGRRYLRTVRETFDAIIVDVPEPQTAQLNRFYTEEFFQSAREHLAPGGLLSFELRSSEEAISPELAAFLRCINRTLREAFPYVIAIPGDPIHFFAAIRPDVLTDDPQKLISRLIERHLETRYVREYFIPFRMMPDRMVQVREQLKPLATTAINRDFSPVAYYFDAVLWNMQFKPDYARWLRTAGQVGFKAVFGLALLVPIALAAIVVMVHGRKRRARASAACCMAAAGFTSMALEILLLLAFEAIYGYVYQQMALLIGLCMAGIAVGSWLGMRELRLGDSSAHRALRSTQLLLAMSAPALMLLVSLLARISGTGTTWLAAQCVFPALAALSGMLGGYQFPMATEIYLQDSGRSRLGTLYGIDLLGGCVGALVLSGYLIPVFGFWRTAWLCSAVNLAPALLAQFSDSDVLAGSSKSLKI